MKKRLFILDGSSLMFRAFYALPLLTAANGEYTNAIYGFSNMMTKLLQDWNPDGMVVAFDKSRHTFRTEMYPEYKGTRDKVPEEFISQIPLLKEMLAAWGIAFIEIDNYEADDIIGTIAKYYSKNGEYESYIVTGDRDALQLIDDNTKIIFTKKGISETIVYDEAVFQEEYGFEPVKLIDLKGLMGDSSDNIPGVPGVGPKTASKLLLEYKSLENVLANAENVAGKKLQEKLIANKDLAILSKQLATINCEAPLDVKSVSLTVEPDIARLTEFCRRYNLKSVIKTVEALYTFDLFSGISLTEQIQKPDISYKTINADDLTSILMSVRAAEKLAVAAMVEGNVPMKKMSAIAIAFDDKLYVADEKMFIDALSQAVAEAKGSIATFDMKNLFHVGMFDGCNREVSSVFTEMTDNWFDVKLAAYLLNAEASDYQLERLLEKYDVGFVYAKPADGKELLAWQAAALLALHDTLKNELINRDMLQLCKKIEMPLVRILAEMERDGIYVNRDSLKEKSDIVSGKISKLQAEIYELAKGEFNINSPKQLGQILFDRLGLPAVKKTKTGYSTNAEVLEELRFVHPIVERILGYRLWVKLKNTYLDAIPEMISPFSGRVHTTFNQTVTATGRLSSSEPNLQNIPVRKEEGREIRTTFEPGDGFDFLLSADYSQIELRILAHLSRDKNFVNAFQNGEDVHARTAAEVFNLPIAEVTAEQRRQAKAVNFGIVYGISDYGLSKDLGISRKQAAEYISTYFEKCSGVKAFLDKTVQEAREKGFVTTMFKRRRELQAINSRNFTQRSLAERMAMNTPVQGSAADIIKLAMIAVYERLKEEKLKSRILLQVHDELVLEVPADELDKVSALIKECMENVVKLTVPLEVDIHFGKTWAEAK